MRHSDDVRAAMAEYAPVLGAASKNITDLFDAAEAAGLGIPQKAIDGALALLALSVGWAHNSIGQPTPPELLAYLLDEGPIVIEIPGIQLDARETPLDGVLDALQHGSPSTAEAVELWAMGDELLHASAAEGGADDSTAHR